MRDMGNKKESKTLHTWEVFNGQKLNTSDIVWFKDSGLAFVDSSLTTGEPNRFSSIPEGWSFGTSVMINERNYGKHGYSHVRKNGWVYRDKELVKCGLPAKWDKITHVLKINKP